MFLEYGLNDHDDLIHISEIPRGRSTMRCPYCGGALTAKKGEIVIAHLAHTGKTCRQAARSSNLGMPGFDDFNLRVPGRIVAMLREFDALDVGGVRYGKLIDYDLIAYNDWSHDHELTKRGKLILGKLSLDLFNKFQEPLIAERMEEMENQAVMISKGYNFRNLDLTTAVMDIRLYRAQWRRFLTTTLYFLAIDDGRYHKIGVTTRPVEDRIAEIRADLALHGLGRQIDVIGAWPRRGNVERYFKYRYRAQNSPLGDLTEYFRFEDSKPVIRDLRRMRPKELSDQDLIILSGAPSRVDALLNR